MLSYKTSLFFYGNNFKKVKDHLITTNSSLTQLCIERILERSINNLNQPSFKIVHNKAVEILVIYVLLNEIM
jgi:hypothetical protein